MPYVTKDTRSKLPLDNVKHEQFARCVAMGNDVFVCYFGVGYPRDKNAALELARRPEIKERCRVYHAQAKPETHRKYGYVHPV